MRLPELQPASNQQLGGAFADALDTLDLDQEVRFQIYTRVVIPIDGYVFWQPINEQPLEGALHITQEIEQSEDETYGAATVAFTTKAEVVAFTQQPIDHLWVGSYRGLRFAFPQQQGFFSPAGLWHYFGRAISPILARQLLDQDGVIDPTRAIVGNSLPLWLALNTYRSPFQAPQKPFLLYPAKLVPPNLPPPYGAVMIGVGDTDALQAFPLTDPSSGSSYQLLSDRVRVRLFGLQADESRDFLNKVLTYGGPDGPGNFGITDAAWVSDDNSRDSNALQAVAMQKQIEFRISYVQSRVLAVAQQLIKQVIATYIVQTPAGAYQTVAVE